MSRAGVGLCCDPENGHGLNLAINRGQLQFLHDYVAWAPGCEFACETGFWYWMKFYKTPGWLKGKAWRDGEQDPDRFRWSFIALESNCVDLALPPQLQEDHAVTRVAPVGSSAVVQEGVGGWLTGRSTHHEAPTHTDQ